MDNAKLPGAWMFVVGALVWVFALIGVGAVVGGLAHLLAQLPAKVLP
ncbi:MAG: hypothetical protein JWP92_3707 [Caulobacter sp.]|nr:hypothetical protein [Caulobacter sp.]